MVCSIQNVLGSTVGNTGPVCYDPESSAGITPGEHKFQRFPSEPYNFFSTGLSKHTQMVSIKRIE